jgi:hypothetical protein
MPSAKPKRTSKSRECGNTLPNFILDVLRLNKVLTFVFVCGIIMSRGEENEYLVLDYWWYRRLDFG